MADLAQTRASFAWRQVREELLGAEPGNVNIARLAVDRQADGTRAAQVALRFIAADDSVRSISFEALRRETNRFANALAGLGVAKGGHVFVLAGRCAHLYVAVLGALKAGCVVTPLFSAFGPEPIATRMKIGQAKLLLTTELLYQRKIAPLRAALPALEQVIVVAEASCQHSTRSPAPPPRTLDYATLMAGASVADPTVVTRADDPALLHFTSGTTGTPKGAIHVHEAVLMHFATGRYALDLQADDIFWCTADPGWVTGTSYGIIAPLLHGVTSIVDEGELALRTGWPSMFRGYLGQEARYRQCFAGDLYLSGDLAKVDADGYFWFIGRADDVIKSAGHLIGPFEVESVLMEHPAVAEAGVIGKPDATVGEVVKAFVALKDGYAASPALLAELLAHARKRLGAAVAPKEIAFAASLPHTRSGKIMRRLLKARELGLPEGDTSTLEGFAS